MALCVSLGVRVLCRTSQQVLRNSADDRLPPDQYHSGETFQQATEDQNNDVSTELRGCPTQQATLPRRSHSEPTPHLVCKSGDHHIRSKTGEICTLRRTDT